MTPNETALLIALKNVVMVMDSYAHRVQEFTKIKAELEEANLCANVRYNRVCQLEGWLDDIGRAVDFSGDHDGLVDYVKQVWGERTIAEAKEEIMPIKESSPTRDDIPFSHLTKDDVTAVPYPKIDDDIPF